MDETTTFTSQTAIPYGLLVMHAMDYHRDKMCPPGPFVKADPPPGGGEIVGYIFGTDTVVPTHPQYAKGPIQLLESRTCYGIVVSRPDNEIVVAIRGTDGFQEWVEDAEFLFQPYAPRKPLPAGVSAQVEQGFWGIYDSFQYVDTNGKPQGPAAEAIAAAHANAARVVVSGHSLGGPLATYLTLDLARGPLAGRVRGLYFASPHPGDQAFADFFGQFVTDYLVYNYILDIVPRVPPKLIGYRSLNSQRMITPEISRADVTVSVGCNHHIVCYLAMLDYEQTLTALTPVPNAESDSWTCVRGPGTGGRSLASMLFERIAEEAAG
jgi:triacylglycerol lipase